MMVLFSKKKKEQERLRLAEILRQEEEQRIVRERREQENEQRQRHLAQEQRWLELTREAEMSKLRLEREQMQQQLRDAEQRRLDAEKRRLDEEQAQREINHKAQLQRDIERAKKQEREDQRLQKMRQTTPKALRELRDLIRERYQLDIEIWNLKGARGPDRPIVQKMMDKADAVLFEILARVETWTENEGAWTEDEWKTAQVVRNRIMAHGKREWKDNPPWNEKSETTTSRAPYV